jgi:hypothetical protein
MFMTSDDKMMELARRRGYLVMEKPDKALREQLSDWCRSEQVPYVTVCKDGKNTARVEMDLMYLPEEFRLMQPQPPYQTYTFIERILDVCERTTGNNGPWYPPGCLTIMYDVPWENAEALARAFLAIYRQEVLYEDDVELPKFPLAIPFKEVRQRLEEAKQQRFAITSKDSRDALHIRYQVWCRAMQEHEVKVIMHDDEMAELSALFAEPQSDETILIIKAVLATIGFNLNELDPEKAVFSLNAKCLSTHSLLHIDVMGFIARLLTYSLKRATRSDLDYSGRPSIIICNDGSVIGDNDE